MAWEIFYALVINLVISYYTRPDPPNQRGPAPRSLSEIEIPTVKDGDPVGVLAGRMHVRNAGVAWYGDLKTDRIRKKGTTIGYKYRLGVHMIVAHTLDSVHEIRVAGRTVWDGTVGDGSGGFSQVNAATIDDVRRPATRQSPTNPTWSDRKDAVVVRLEDLSIRWVYGTEVESGTGTPFPPATPAGSILLAHVQWSWDGANAWDMTYFNGVRVDENFENPDTELQVSGVATFFDNTGLYGEFDISAGGIAGTLTEGTLYIDKPDLFGGRKREGGIVGPVDIALGGPAQAVNPYLAGELGDVPAFRGLTALILRQVYVGTTGRVKPWAVTGQREPAGWSGAPSGLIGNDGDANPAHLVYEWITNTRWGMARNASRVNTTDFDAAATTLINEAFGLSFFWSDPEPDAEEYVRDIARHIDASVYVDPVTAEWRIKLHRDDYNVAGLDTLDPSNVDSVQEFSRPGWGEIVSQLTLVYTDGEPGSGGEAPSWRPRSVTQHDLAVMRNQGGRSIHKKVEYRGITKGALANRVLARDMSQLARPLARVHLTLIGDQDGIRPGDVYKWVWPDYGVTQMILRIVEVEYGTLDDGRVKVKAIEDAFGTASAVYADPTPTDWVDPVTGPSPAPHRRLAEATYYHVAVDLDGSSALLGDVADTEGRLLTQAVEPGGDAFGYTVYHDAGGGYIEDTGGEFTPTGLLAGPVEPGQTDLLLQAGSTIGLAEVETGTIGYMGSEIFVVTAVDTFSLNVTVQRGMIDTVPVAHAQGTRVWFAGAFESLSDSVFTDGELVDVKLIPTTALGELDLAQAPADAITFDARFIRPYPPGRVRLDGAAWPGELFGPLVLTWAHRDRVAQGTGLVDQDALDVGPEAGTTYTVRVTDRNTATQIHEETDIAGAGYDDSDGADCLTPSSAPVSIRIELLAERDGWPSWQAQTINTERRGYGFAYLDSQGALTYGGFAANA